MARNVAADDNAVDPPADDIAVDPPVVDLRDSDDSETEVEFPVVAAEEESSSSSDTEEERPRVSEEDIARRYAEWRQRGSRQAEDTLFF